MLFSQPEPDDRELEVLADVEDLKRRLRHRLREPRRWYRSLRRLSEARQIQGSNTIEGYDASLDDAAAIAAGEEPLDADEETRRALSGYREAMTYVLQLAADEDFSYSAQLIKSLHFMMTSYDLQNRPGRWRLGDIYVRKDETGEIVYQGPDVYIVAELMENLVSTLNAESARRAGRGRYGALEPDDDPPVPRRQWQDGSMPAESLILARSRVLAPVFWYRGVPGPQYSGPSPRCWGAVAAGAHAAARVGAGSDLWPGSC